MNNLSTLIYLLFDLAIPKSKFLNNHTSEIIYSNENDLCNQKINDFCKNNNEILEMLEKQNSKIIFSSFEDMKNFLKNNIFKKSSNKFLFELNEVIIFSFFSSSIVLKGLPIPITENEIIEALEK